MAVYIVRAINNALFLQLAFLRPGMYRNVISYARDESDVIPSESSLIKRRIFARARARCVQLD